MMNRRKQADITAAKLGHWKDPAVLLKRYVHAGKLPQVAEAIFGEGAERSGTALTHARGARLQVGNSSPCGTARGYGVVSVRFHPCPAAWTKGAGREAS